jgi:hypothetical protein
MWAAIPRDECLNIPFRSQTYLEARQRRIHFLIPCMPEELLIGPPLFSSSRPFQKQLRIRHVTTCFLQESLLDMFMFRVVHGDWEALRRGRHICCMSGTAFNLHKG